MRCRKNFVCVNRRYRKDEQALVEALIAQAAVDAVDKAILRQFARCYVVPFNATRCCQARMAFEVDLLPNLPSFIRRICSSFAPGWGMVRTRLMRRR